MMAFSQKSKWGSWAKYVALGLAVFAIGLVWNFPYEQIRQTLTSKLSKQTGYQFDVNTLSPALPFGFVAKGARVSGPSIGEMPVDLELDRLKVTLSPLSLLYPFRKIVSASFSAERKKDRFWGSLDLGKEASGVVFQTKNFQLTHTIPLSQFDPLFTGSELKISGSLTLSLELDGATPALQRTDLSAADGELTITGKNVKIEAPLVKMLTFDSLTIDATMKKGKVNIKSVVLSGPGINGKASGSLKMEPFYIRSQLNLDTKITIDEKAANLRTLITTLAASQGLSMDETGTLAMKVRGSLDRLGIHPY